MLLLKRRFLAGLIPTRSSLPAINLLVELLIDQKMMNETNEFPGHGNDCHIVLLLFAQPLEESGQPCIFHICYGLGSLDKYNSDVLGTTLCDSTFSLFACRFIFSWIEATPFGELLRRPKISVISDL
jgi:hypothetical protein